MGAFDEAVEAVPRRTMVLIFLVDTSGSMKGEKIGSLNVAIQEVLPFINDISASNADAQIKVAALEFSSGTEWMYPEPVDVADFEWRDLEAGGLTCLGEACAELGSKLSLSHGFMREAAGSFAPAIILLSDGEPTDDYKRGIEKLKGNGWYRAAIKVAIAIGKDADQDVLAEFTTNKEAVLTVHNKEQLRKIIRFVSVTASQVGSKNASVGQEAPETKQTENLEKLQEEIKNDKDLQGVETGTEVGGNPPAGAADDWDW